MYAIFFHAHQKLDRVAYRHLRRLSPDSYFPRINRIVHFEGNNGPDAAKLKKHATSGQPWHFVDPHDETDTNLYKQITYHHKQLVQALKVMDDVRAAFEAAWLAHALVDGLTPAHHYPYEKELENLRGEDRTTRKGILGRGYVKSDTFTDSMHKSFKLIGPKGLLTNHAMFEAGAWAIMQPLRFTSALPSRMEMQQAAAMGTLALFKQMVCEVAGFDLYGRYITEGWTQNLTKDVRRELAPRMVQMITLAWHNAVQEANK